MEKGFEIPFIIPSQALGIKRPSNFSLEIVIILGNAIAGDREIPLQGNLKGFWSIRINQQWRIIFRWNGGNASDVQITDYY